MIKIKLNMFNLIRNKSMITSKKLLIVSLILVAFTFNVGSQVIISQYTGGLPDSSAMLELRSNAWYRKGFLLPRTLVAEIHEPTNGLMVYDISSKKIVYFNGEEWRGLDGSINEIKVGTETEDGFVFYVDSAGKRGLIATKSDIGVGEYGCNGTFLGITDSSVYAGYNNTNEIIEKCYQGEIAARLSKYYIAGGYDEWYLPSIDELTLLLKNASLIDSLEYGPFYASSTELDSTSYLGLSLIAPETPFVFDKSIKLKVRPIRSFGSPSQTVYLNNPKEGNHIVKPSNIIWKWYKVDNANGYKWNVTNDFSTAEEIEVQPGNIMLSKIENEIDCNKTYQRYVWAYNNEWVSSSTELVSIVKNIPLAPEIDTVIASFNYLTFTWIIQPGVTGFLWNTEDNIQTAEDLGFITSITLTNLEIDFMYCRYLWAYNGCDYSPSSLFCGLTLPLPPEPPSCPGVPSITDIEGNVYNTVLIGSQCWMKENLKTTNYSNGNPIQNLQANTTWLSDTAGAYAWNSNNITWKDAYGALYNWYAVSNSQGLCPEGWHVPDRNDVLQMQNYLTENYDDVDIFNLGMNLKSCRSTMTPISGNCLTDEHPRWFSDNAKFGTDSFGFSGLPGGMRNTGIFMEPGDFGAWWTSSQVNFNSNKAYFYSLLNTSDGFVGNNYNLKNMGYSVRCIMD